MTFINVTQTIGQVVTNANTTITGSMYITLLVVMLILIAICFLFSIPLSITAIIVLPLWLAYMAYYSDFIGGGMTILIYLAFVITKDFFIR